jgi:tetratricopeptide (TPR) repeat protein
MMKIHPHELLLRELVEAVSDEHKCLLEHLLACEPCRERVLPFLRRRPNALAERVATVLHWSGDGCDYSQVFACSEISQEQCLFSFDRERAEAKGLLAELATHPLERRVLILENHPRFHTWGLLELLIERGREAGYAEPVRGEDLGNLALRLAGHLDAEVYGLERIEDLKARAWAGIGNSRRVRSDLSGAEVAMERAQAHLRRGTGDLLERAIVLDLRASLLRAQRRFDRALRLLQRAFNIFLEYGDIHRAGRALLNMSTVYHSAGTPERAIPLLYRAIELIDSQEEPLLVLAIWHNLIDDLADAGRYMEAHGLLSRAHPVYRRFPDSSTQNRRKWVQGKIARGLGQPAEAEALLLAARDGFLAAGGSYDTALVSLDLASLYAEKGRTVELKSLAEEIFPVFTSRGIHREALAALLFLRQAIAAERASLELVTRISCYLKRAQHDPELRFEQP